MEVGTFGEPSFWVRFVLIGFFVAVGAVFVYYGGRLAMEIAANVLGRRLTRRDRLVLAAFVPLVLMLAWRLNFRQFSYGSASAFLFAMALIWLRNLLRGDTWMGPQDRRFNSEYIGPATLLFIGVMLLWSAISPFI